MENTTFHWEFPDLFLNALEQLVGSSIFTSNLKEQIKSEVSQIVSLEKASLSDEQAVVHLEVCAFILAAYRTLHQLDWQNPQTSLFELLKKAAVEPSRDFARQLTRQTLDKSANPFSVMVEMSKNQEEFFFGKSFAFERASDNENSYHLLVKKCFYHQFFARYGSPELARIGCEFDYAWIESIKPEKDGFIFSRPSTLAKGGDCCRFLFDKIAN